MSINVLVISAVPWNTNSNFGSSYSGIFTGIEGIEIDNIFLADGNDNDNIVKRSFEISERRLIKSIYNRKEKTGVEKEILLSYKKTENALSVAKTLGKRHKLMVLYLIRDIIWRIGKWKTKELNEFITSCSPDVMFLPINGSAYPNRIALEIAKDYHLPIIGYISDDNYTLRVFSLSPIFWLRRMVIRHFVGRVIRTADYVYVISQKQKEKYDEIFGINTKILTKGIDDACVSPEYTARETRPYKMCFTGNLGIGRWKSISLLAEAMEKINKNEMNIELYIYSPTSLTNRMKHRIEKKGVYYCGAIPPESVAEVQAKADILVHVESIDFFNRWSALYGFSTKIVDYMIARKPIIALGTRQQASIQYLCNNQIAFVGNSKKEVENILEFIVNNPEELKEKADKAYNLAKQNHSRQKFQKMIKGDIEKLAFNRKNNYSN